MQWIFRGDHNFGGTVDSVTDPSLSPVPREPGDKANPSLYMLSIIDYIATSTASPIDDDTHSLSSSNSPDDAASVFESTFKWLVDSEAHK